MHIVYIAKHNSGGNDDEGAITHCLEEFGHRVTRIQERYALIEGQNCPPCDLILFHKWTDVNAIASLKNQAPRAFWYFDMVENPDPLLLPEVRARMKWMASTIPNCEFGFCTDGDWVREQKLRSAFTILESERQKLVWLMQGADGRYVGQSWAAEKLHILFTGRAEFGVKRSTFVAEMFARWNPKFIYIQRGLHDGQLRDRIGTSAIVVAPDSPGSDYYWSNRLFLMLGFGAFLIHPYYKGIDLFYPGPTPQERGLCLYSSREELHSLIDYYLHHPVQRREIAAVGLERTRQSHLYHHRVEKLLAIVQGKTNAAL